jgi:hypothetical protein
MPTDFDIETLIEQENSFVRANSVECSLPIHKVVTSCLEWEREGVPFVVQGVPLDTGSETPFGVSTKWLRTLFSTAVSLLFNLSEIEPKMLQDHQMEQIPLARE